MNISQVLHQLNYSLDRLETSDELHQALMNIESATNLLNESNLKMYEEVCSKQLLQKKIRVVKNSGGENSYRSINEIREMIVKLSQEMFPLLDKPSSVQQLDLVSSIAKFADRFDTNDHAALKAFASWISLNEIPLADLNWRPEDIFMIAPYLSTANLTEFRFEILERESGMPIEEFIRNFRAAKKIIFLGTPILEGVKRGISSLDKLEDLYVVRCHFHAGLLDFSKIPNLSHLVLKEIELEKGSLDFTNCKVLKSLEVIALAKFKGPIFLPKSGALEEITIDYLTEFNSKVNFRNCPHVKNITLNLLRSFNEEIDLTQCEELESLTISSCDQWEKGLVLPKKSQLKIIDLTDCRKLPGDLTPLGNYYSLEKINLTNCRNFVSNVDFSGLSGLKYVSMQNCLQYQGRTDFSNPKNLEYLNLKGLKIKTQKDEKVP
jgi:hypothetical protein